MGRERERMSRRRNIVGKIVHRQRETSRDREKGWMYFVSLFSICTRSEDNEERGGLKCTKGGITLVKKENTDGNNECHAQSIPESRNAFCSSVSLTAANTNRIYTMRKGDDQ